MDEDGYAYPKFVDEDVFDVQFQEKEDDHKAVRFISSIDSLEYQAVGFTVSGTYGEREIAEDTYECSSVYKRIIANDETFNAGDFYKNSKRLTTFTVRGMDGVTDSSWTVQPYIVTPDGTKVQGIKEEIEFNH